MGLVKVRVGGKTVSKRSSRKSKKDGSSKRCHNKKCSACDEQMETKYRSKGREEIKMADHQIYLSKRT